MTLVYAHRGASAAYPENTSRAFRAALAAGADGIEFDVRLSADGVPVVIHDRDLARTTNGRGNVDDLTFQQLQSLDAGAGEKIPALADVLTLVGPAVHLDIELKNAAGWSATLDVLRGFPRSGYAISSFDWDILRNIRRHDPLIALWPLATECHNELLAIAAELGSPLVALHAAAFTPANADRLRRAGFEAMVWTVNDAAEARRVSNLGAYALCTDDPLAIAPAIRGMPA